MITNSTGKESKESKLLIKEMICERTSPANSEITEGGIESSDKRKPKKKIKCHHCQKKLKLMQQIQCQCNHYFCPQHMNRHSHNCPCNIKQTIKDEIEKKNPKIHVKMIDKI